MDRETLGREIGGKSQISGHFVLRSGGTSDTYFDKYQFESDPVVLRAIAEHMAALVPDDVEILCGLEMGGIPVVAVLSQVMGRPCAFLRKQRKAHGTMKYAEGPELRGRKIALIEDVVSSGGAIIDAAKMLGSEGINVDLAVCVIDRQSGGSENLAKEGIELISVFRMEDIRG